MISWWAIKLDGYARIREGWNFKIIYKNMEEREKKKKKKELDADKEPQLELDINHSTQPNCIRGRCSCEPFGYLSNAHIN